VGEMVRVAVVQKQSQSNYKKTKKSKPSNIP